MGGISRMNRNGRFIKKIEKAVVEEIKKRDFQIGDWLEVKDIIAAPSEDGNEVVKTYFVLESKSTGDQTMLTFDECLFDPEGEDHTNVDRLTYALCGDRSDEDEFKAAQKKAVRLLKKADLINQKYQAEEETA